MTGYIHELALIGQPAEHRNRRPGDPIFEPDIHASARIEAFVTVDAGTFMHTTIGARTWLMKKVHVGHDAWIGTDCEIAPLTSIGGEVTIGNGVKIGQGATVKPRVTIQGGARIGMGAVVTKDVPAGETWVGNPARKLEPICGAPCGGPTGRCHRPRGHAGRHMDRPYHSREIQP